MNLIHDAWIPAVRMDGTRTKIAPWQIAETDNPVIELCAPRPDFQGALYQFLIGLLQTCAAPEDIDEWWDWFETPPEIEHLKSKFSIALDAMNLFSPVGEPAFLQDLDLPIETKKLEPVNHLYIDHNETHFNHPPDAPYFCASCAAQAIFTLQAYAPPGGSGHMTSIRDNGPLTTLLAIKDSPTKSLWHNLWLNVIEIENFECRNYSKSCSDTFPWLETTKSSESCTTIGCPNGCSKCSTFPSKSNYLQHYWGMPKRIRLLEDTTTRTCVSCGQTSNVGCSSVFIKNKGIRYTGGWQHPLTPYVHDKKKEKLPIALSGRIGHSCYKNWLGIVLNDEDARIRSAKNVQCYFDSKTTYISKSLQSRVLVWAYGFAIKAGQAKAICWYEHLMPIFHTKPNQIKNLRSWAGELLIAAKETTPLIKTHVKEAWYRNTEGAKGDMSFIDIEFWIKTEDRFYELVAELSRLPEGTNLAPASIYSTWRSTLYHTAGRLFDQYTLETSAEDLDLKRVVLARTNMIKKFNSLKSIKELKIKGTPSAEEANA